jgi:hypothetical protein
MHLADADLARPLVGSERRQTEKGNTGDKDGNAHGDVHDLRCLPLLRIRVARNIDLDEGVFIGAKIALQRDWDFVWHLMVFLAVIQPVMDA